MNPIAGGGSDVRPAVADAQQFRRTVSLFATGIAIITCEDQNGSVHGITINSFTSISLDPPTILISLKAGRAHSLISSRGSFGVSILDESQQSYSAHFSGRPQPSLAPDFIVRERQPTLRHCLAWLECDIVERIQVHDHTLFVARVTHCSGLEGSPLMFYASRYHRAAVPA